MKKAKKAGTISTFLGPESSIEGILEFQGTIRLDGNVKGKICSSSGTVIVGEKAVINADIIVDGAVIMGEVNGTIDAKDRIEVYPPGRVTGDIYAPVISIDSGATFNGNCGMKAQDVSREKTSEPGEESPKPGKAGDNV
ncbi:hypothetical protein DENIS_5078 [Desulfonema ishimotonii]|uniref:Polymer-forming cytoskeletal protein n=1 Tax=Desulfonema ishimotonii TaxID=45657 RepID=A0A401G4D0_9BACT|nr:polymer-forming cytoskeletal protein [Desulfonema ishimotonii]GBC64076.1 hypothetical protein DENIS_5078 [Desulfonema ishimotonii]